MHQNSFLHWIDIHSYTACEPASSLTSWSINEMLWIILSLEILNFIYHKYNSISFLSFAFFIFWTRLARFFVNNTWKSSIACCCGWVSYYKATRAPSHWFIFRFHLPWLCLSWCGYIRIPYPSYVSFFFGLFSTSLT